MLSVGLGIGIGAAILPLTGLILGVTATGPVAGGVFAVM